MPLFSSFRAGAPTSSEKNQFKPSAGASAEETRLLGGSGKRDADAVPIGRPRSRLVNPVTAVKVTLPSGGPRPTNTLSLDRNPPRSQTNQAAKAKARRGIHNQLKTETSRGGNVETMPHATEPEELFSPPPSAKRRKLEQSGNSQTSSESIQDDFDMLGGENVTFVSSQSASQVPSAQSQESGRRTTRQGSSSKVKEYQNLERMMDSSNYKNQKHHQSNDTQLRNLGGLPTSPLVKHQRPIDMSADGEVEKPDTQSKSRLKPSYQGTAQPNALSRRSKGPSGENGKKSGYFNKPSANKRGPEPFEPPKLPKLVTHLRPNDQDEYLRNKFVPSNGKRRSMDINLSSDADELTIGTTIGAHADTKLLSPTKHSRPGSSSNGSSSTLEITSPAEENEGLKPSNIPAANFSTSDSKDRSNVRSRRRDSPDRWTVREAKPPWSIDVAAISIGGAIWRDDGIGLVRENITASYNVLKAGVKKPYRIRPDKLQKILREESGVKVRFESSKTQHEDNILDIELCKENDVSDLVQRLHNESTCKVISYPSEYMERIFEKKRSDFRKMTKQAEGILVDFGCTQKEQTREVAKQIDLSVMGNTKRPRAGYGVVDTLIGRATQEDDTGLSQRKTRPSEMPHGLPNYDSVDTAQGSPGISSILQKIKAKPDNNPHLRRSVRRSGVSEKLPQDILSSLDEALAAERYSKTHGLGDEWKKPLTYPKMGKKKTTVEWSDLERLDEGEFLNDNLISFYLRFLEQNLEERRPDLAKRVYFFNTFFYATLTNVEKRKQWINYEGVQKWTRSVDLFTYDYIVVPINEASHWYLAIICNLPALNRDLAIPEDDPISPIVGDPATKPTFESSPLPTSSPIDKAAEGHSKTWIEGSEETHEKEARSSFAEMSLENDIQQSTATAEARKEDTDINGAGMDAIESTADDLEMLDTQIEGIIAVSITLNVADDHQAKPEVEQVEVADDTIKGLDQNQKASVASKKRKRKSIPPVMAIDPSKPVIITFDSLGTSRFATVRALKHYLHEEGKAKRGGMEWDDKQIKGITAKQIPQQDNFSDCGLFLLGYVEKLLEDDPKDFIAKIITRGYDEKTDWPRLIPSDMRSSIRDQVQKLHETQQDERREGSAKKTGKFSAVADRKPDSSPTRVKDTAKRPRSESEAGEQRATSKISEPQTTISPTTRNEALNTAQNIDAEAPEEANGKTFEETDRELKAAAGRIHKIDVVDEPSFIVIDSQSQQDGAGPRSYRYSQPLLEKQESFELPSVIQDSQPSLTSNTPHTSETARTFAEILCEKPSTVEPVPAEKPTSKEPRILVGDPSPKRPQERNDRSRHEKSGNKTPQERQREALEKRKALESKSSKKAQELPQNINEVIDIDDD